MCHLHILEETTGGLAMLGALRCAVRTCPICDHWLAKLPWSWLKWEGAWLQLWIGAVARCAASTILAFHGILTYLYAVVQSNRLSGMSSIEREHSRCREHSRVPVFRCILTIDRAPCNGWLRQLRSATTSAGSFATTPLEDTDWNHWSVYKTHRTTGHI